VAILSPFRSRLPCHRVDGEQNRRFVVHVETSKYKIAVQSDHCNALLALLNVVTQSKTGVL